MKTSQNPLITIWDKIPSSAYLWAALLIKAASSSITRQVTQIGEQHLINGRNPISLCNVLFVGNICALAVMLLFFAREWHINTLKRFSRQEWISLIIVAIISGALAPALFFSALDQTNVTNVVLISRLEPTVTLILSIWVLKARVKFWTILGSLVSFAGIVTTVLLGNPDNGVVMMGGAIKLGIGELETIAASLISVAATLMSQAWLDHIPVGIFSVTRTALGAVVFFILANYLYGPEHFIDVFSPLLWQWMLFYGAIIVVAGQICALRGYRGASPALINLTSSINPIVAIMMAFLILGEVPTKAQYVGGSIIILGICLSLLANVRRASFKPLRFNIGRWMEMDDGFKGV
ncbi:DMT family transporter [Gloeothece verrucosa]|uniref:EamA domain-containing protein n=1 Tax=Gloeothece verrucosa (strain PCC 7822) TaxID=497965 RepID=E0UGQ8_GLOV7|nr:DMT family transporter [Gloeothece verrucosa]ADN13267.1 protein of unknown function DUF6 transmembrane [Gloeothece verrucosa PCC 7822]